ncbi:disease resistance protein RPP8-like [Salvia hispanica]|uniref:disease resistance protein RPP8-like n=1 Tax=Salvia hispanica TaxID=49212 RepID=UPI002009B58C|nr:disease resistance protein RPP8-like [Salvia hispanica]
MQHLAIHFRNEVQHELIVTCGEDTREHIRSIRLSNVVGSDVVEFPPQSIIDFQKFKFLRDLVILRFKFAAGKLPRGITKLVHLRRLRLEECELDKLPSSMRNLVYLDTLDLRYSMNVEVPNVFKDMLRLKHLFLPLYGNVNAGSYRVRLDGVYELETLLWLDSRYHEFKCMGRMTNLRHFSAITYDNERLSAIMNAIMNWNKIREWKALANCGSDLLSSKLRYLDLNDCEIEDDPMGILGKLPWLAKLELCQKSFVGEELTCPTNSFLRLKILALRELPALREWRVEAGAMPRLFKLTIGECSCLEMVPEGLSAISTLQTLVIQRMPELSKRISPSGQDFHKVCHVPSIIIKD